MSVCISLHHLFTQLKSVRTCMSTISLQFSRRFCLTHNYSQMNCCMSTMKTSRFLRYQRLSVHAVLKSEETSWQNITWRCGFHTTPQRYIHPLFWMVIRPLAKVASALTGRLMHVILLRLLKMKILID